MSLSELDTARFRLLLDRWNSHQDLRHHCADLATLTQSRLALDAARAELHRHAA
jgi:hypothetical protein